MSKLQWQSCSKAHFQGLENIKGTQVKQKSDESIE